MPYCAYIVDGSSKPGLQFYGAKTNLLQKDYNPHSARFVINKLPH